MLFDLRSPGRRRMIKVIYTFLAILMAVGLVGFGIGGATSGGIFDVSGGCGGNDTNNTFQEDVDKAEKRTQTQPSNPAAWAALTRAQYQLAATQADQTTGAFSDEGRKDLLATDPDVFFTTPHFDGYAAVLVRLDRISVEDLEEVVVEAWLARAPKRLAQAYLDASS